MRCHLLRIRVEMDTNRKTANGISGISLAILGDRMRMKNVSPRMAINRADISKPRKGYAIACLTGAMRSFDAPRASIPPLPAHSDNS